MGSQTYQVLRVKYLKRQSINQGYSKLLFSSLWAPFPQKLCTLVLRQYRCKPMDRV